ncbi:MAG: zf-TFIIB domain-containing protein [Proteobacteria bacterium]|jgi:uncharacterized protein|nr:zf-TFIIB domain-containing protein [Pseudomonadota bacterium]MDA1301243.1 zf-TFIIB domain-containing protein [Pseudomonadota bacterium]
MECPKCLGDMNLVDDEVTAVSRCNHCQGLYFDLLTRQNLDEVAARIHLDTGDESVGKEFDEMVFVECPKCNQIMDQRSVDDPVQIRFELCVSCHATFLDAGEYRQYMSDEYLDAFRALLPPV